ncbi:Uma2 family endonuclease [Nocardia cyriacigeorgica]|uniref:Uma2 family endonuclease n=1 Tax=Nocardia cyriacigeorgica TaxID=135487 RepID=A0A6P1D7Z1_9NOCA|nr:Uma2 family endonuclease [Nocardia cyriacigeorgica]NEW40609.1 Uma2 family endonuclease [Nocardia cyriacigeorgica]NEW45080.1 Uma2 family endonuclease [Nocardia cyriacigeorgica]NEW51163.1 Uma2 family endonuclease [Nocardia cyriacigeorgica]NEW54252.1 Uma2 family endonuclease [Nocardia cyriacigeorgica]
MTVPRVERPELPEFMTWDELERLPEEIAKQIELWNGRVVWLRRGPAEHQTFTVRVRNAIEQCARKTMSNDPETCWRVTVETNVFLGNSGKSDFLTPDFLVHRCLGSPYQDLRASDTLIVGEVLSPSNTQSDMESKKARYASAGIPWYWEVSLAREDSAIATVRAYALETEHGRLPQGVRPLRPANYLVAGEWTRDDANGIEIDFPFPITIPWSELEY